MHIAKPYAHCKVVGLAPTNVMTPSQRRAFARCQSVTPASKR